MPSADKYTDPELRDQVKKEIQDSDKGGEPGQWSARKAQFMAAEYKKRGGGYTTDKETGQDESQQNLSKWTEEEWQTKEGSGHAQKEDGTQQRYLPKKAWEQMDEDEKESTDQKKQHESKQGKQFVGNTDKAKNARKNANEEEAENFEEKKSNEQSKQSQSGSNAKSSGASKGNSKPKSKSTQGKSGAAGGSGDRQAKGAAKNDMNRENYDPEDIDMGDDDEEEEEPQDDDDFAPDGDDDDAADDDEDMEDIDDPDDKAAIDGQEAPAGNPEDEDAAEAEGLASGDDDDDAVAGEVDDDNDEAGEKEDSTKPARPATKRAASSGPLKGSQKSQKANSGGGKPNGTYGSKHDKDEAPGKAGSADRLPKKGQRVTWKAMPGFVHGKVLEVVTEDKQMEGKSIKASKDDPKIALEADSGKFCVHKPDAMFYD